MERESFAEDWVGGLVWDGGGDGWQGVEWMRCLKVEQMRWYGRDCGVLDVFACASVQAGFSPTLVQHGILLLLCCRSNHDFFCFLFAVT
jgi:hypothetical protein